MASLIGILRVFIIAMLFSLVVPFQAAKLSAEESVRSSMTQVYQAFRQLERFLVSRDRFTNPDNHSQISELLQVLQNGFHRVDSLPSSFARDPGFQATLRVLNDTLSDSANRFASGRTGYAWWRLRRANDFCISCHTRYEIPTPFSSDGLDLEGLSLLEQGDFWLATRNFPKAREAFIAAAQQPPQAGAPYSDERIEALRRWLIIQVRVDPDPAGSARALQKIVGTIKLGAEDKREVAGWLDSFHRWQHEGSVTLTPQRRAEHLIQQAVHMQQPQVGKNGTVELLRATALLHRFLESGGSEAVRDRAQSLRLLGVAYHELTLSLVEGFPQQFLEECIRVAPGSDDARKAYVLLAEIITADFTGSAGTNLPAEERELLRSLYELAYGVPAFRGRV